MHAISSVPCKSTDNKLQESTTLLNFDNVLPRGQTLNSLSTHALQRSHALKSPAAQTRLVEITETVISQSKVWDLWCFLLLRRNAFPCTNNPAYRSILGFVVYSRCVGVLWVIPLKAKLSCVSQIFMDIPRQNWIDLHNYTSGKWVIW